MYIIIKHYVEYKNLEKKEEEEVEEEERKKGRGGRRGHPRAVIFTHTVS